MAQRWRWGRGAQIKFCKTCRRKTAHFYDSVLERQTCRECGQELQRFI